MVTASVPLPVLKLSTPKTPFTGTPFYLILEPSSDLSNGSFSAQGNWYRRRVVRLWTISRPSRLKIVGVACAAPLGRLIKFSHHGSFSG